MRLSMFKRLNGCAAIRCTGDFDFDNRYRYSGVTILDDQTVLARRRLHDSSLKNRLRDEE